MVINKAEEKFSRVGGIKITEVGSGNEIVVLFRMVRRVLLIGGYLSRVKKKEKR